jgi:AcrR family transcriptional regulator
MESVHLNEKIMDLRIIKTKKNIRDAFLQLRSDNALEKIKVTHLCELAMINKTTFYKHYQDIYALSEEIENQTILSIMDSFDHLDTLFSDPAGFIKGLYYAFKSHEDLIMTVFSERMDILIGKIENLLIVHYPRLSAIPEQQILLSFLLWGGSHVLMESRYEETLMLDTLIKAAKDIISIINVQAHSK